MLETNRIPGLDLLRFAAALAVMAFHLAFHGGMFGGYLITYDPSLGFWTKYGYLGVDVFFVISGLVIAWSAEGSTAAKFAWNRWLRVYPTYILMVVITSAIIKVSADAHFTVTANQLFAHLIVDARRLGHPLLDGSYWTIVAELFFYAMTTVGLAVPALRKRSWELFVLWLMISIANEFYLKTAFLSYFLLSKYCGLFITGIMLFRVFRGQPTFKNIALLVLAVTYAMERAVDGSFQRFAGANLDWSPYTVGFTLAMALLMLVASLFIKVNQRTAIVFRFLGALTYPLYLLHQTAGYILINLWTTSFGTKYATIMAMATIAIVSGIIAYYVEPRMKFIIKQAQTRALAFFRTFSVGSY